MITHVIRGARFVKHGLYIYSIAIIVFPPVPLFKGLFDILRFGLIQLIITAETTGVFSLVKSETKPIDFFNCK